MAPSLPASRLDPAAPDAMCPSDDEKALFRAAAAGVRRRPPPNRVDLSPVPPPPAARQREADDRQVLAELLASMDPEDFECGETLSYRAEGVQDGVMRRLRRGQYRVERVLDLHGLNRERARAAVAQFLLDCRRHDWRCVRIIHGKGNRSPNTGPVLKAAVDRWLRRRREVLAFCSARPADGGSGAIYVLLRTAD